MQKTFRVRECYTWSALKLLLGTMLLLFVINGVNKVWFSNDFLEKYLCLSLKGLKAGYLWQLMSHMFMHEGIWHIFCNIIVLLPLGHLIEQKYGSRRLLGIFLISGVIGAITWLLVHYRYPYCVLLGASAGCLGVLSYFCLGCENRPMTFLLFFIIPIRLRPRILLAIMTGIELYCFFIQELSNGRVANSAHLGGILGGCICYCFYQYRQKYINMIKRKLNLKSCGICTMYGDSYKLYITSYSAKRREVDRILDKINENGFKSLTEAERNTLNSAKYLMHR